MPRLTSIRPDQDVLVRGPGRGQFQAARTVPQPFPAASVTAVTLTWSTPFVDSNYTVITEVIDDDGSGDLIGGSTSAPVKTVTGVTVIIENADQSNAHQGHVEAIAVHD